MTNQPLQIVLVDDDDIDRELVGRLLVPRFSLREASTGKDALDLIRTQRPDCLLLDYRLPDLDGLRLLPEFTRAYIPVIILTVEENPEVIVQSIQSGAQDYLVKSRLTQIGLDHAIRNAIEKMRLKRDVDQKNQQVFKLASALTLAEQHERRRVAEVLHDHVQQTLYSIQMRLHLLNLELADQEKSKEHIEAVNLLLNEAIATTRTLTVELSPPALQREGLNGAFRWLCGYMAERYNLRVTLETEGSFVYANSDLTLLIFQLARELLFNVVKHAGVDEALLSVYSEEEQLCVCVLDRGIGYNADAIEVAQTERHGVGLYHARERLELFGGKLKIVSSEGVGTRATLSVPLARLNRE